MNKSALIEILKTSGTNFVGLDTVTTQRVNKYYKTDDGERVLNPFYTKDVKKHSKLTVELFSNTNANAYESMVKRRLGPDADNFKLQPRIWGERIPETPLVIHKGKLYLEYIANQHQSTHYTVDGEVTSKFNIILPPKKKEGKQGGLKNKVIIRTVAVENIVGIRINGQRFEF